MIVHINYANQMYKETQLRNSKTALEWGADVSINYNQGMLDAGFVAVTEDILKEQRGAGFWCWKPQIILQTMRTLKENDIVFYTDCGCDFIDRIAFLSDYLLGREYPFVMPFLVHGKQEKYYTKIDLFNALECNKPEFTESEQHCASFIIIKKNDRALDFLNSWLINAKDKHRIDNSLSIIPEVDDFVEHRHDQSIYSLLAKKWELPSFADPSQWGKDFQTLYPQILDHHRISG